MNTRGRWRGGAMAVATFAVAVVGGGGAAAQPAGGAEATAPAAPAVPAAPPATPNLNAPDDTEEPDIDPLAKLAELEARLDQQQTVIVGRQPRVIVGGYLDLGFFAAQGNGSGIVRDQGNMFFPQYAGKYGWVFLGDILSPAINTRGEVADLGDATGAPPRFDSIHSAGAPGFIANEVNLNLTSGLGPSAIATASINFTPRSG